MSEWISVKDRLPHIGEVVLLYITYPVGTCFNCRADPLPRNFTRVGGLRYNEEFVSYENQYEYLMNVSHWMPLPKPPQSDKLISPIPDEFPCIMERLWISKEEAKKMWPDGTPTEVNDVC